MKIILIIIKFIIEEDLSLVMQWKVETSCKAKILYILILKCWKYIIYEVMNHGQCFSYLFFPGNRQTQKTWNNMEHMEHIAQCTAHWPY